MIRGERTVAQPSATVGVDEPPWDLAGGDGADVFGWLFDRYAPSIHRYLATRVGAQIADDLVADTFLAALRSRNTFDPSLGTPQAWLFGIATNLLRNHRRSEGRHLTATTRHLVQTSSTTPVDDGVEQRLDAAAAVKRLVPDLLRLDVTDRDILLLNAWAGLTPAEIAVALNMPAGTVRSRLHRLRRTLQAAWPTTFPAASVSLHPANPAIAAPTPGD